MFAEIEVSSMFFIVDEEVSEISVYALVSDDDHKIFSVVQGASVKKQIIKRHQFYFYNIIYLPRLNYSLNYTKYFISMGILAYISNKK